MDENVLVVPAESISQHLASSFDPASARAVIQVANRTRLFRPRSQVEQDESVKQIIPYVCIRCGESYVLLQRTNKQSEARLHNKFSLGIGGHINDAEQASPDLVDAGLQRELSEEITLTGGYTLKPLGIIYDATTPVGRVHLGVVYELEACDQSFTLNEPDLMSARWVSAQELGAFRDRMETWSQILFDNHIATSAVC
jgi:predicted NUDIX family phosphoesterase